MARPIPKRSNRQQDDSAVLKA